MIRKPKALPYLILYATLIGAPQAAIAEYKLRAGDVVELKVVGMPDLGAKYTIGPDGIIHLPYFGNVVADSRTQSEVLSDLRAMVPSKVIQIRLPDGKQQSFVLSPDEVSLNIDEYRPVYVYGYVQHPGVIPFRPGITARQAISQAGGMGIDTLGSLAVSDLKLEYRVTLQTKTAVEAKLARVTAEIDGKEHIDVPDGSKSPAFDLAQQQFDLEMQTFHADVAYREKLVSTAQTQLDQTRNRDLTVAQEMKESDKDIAIIRSGFDKGSIPLLHFNELRREGEATRANAFLSQLQIGQAIRDGVTAERDLKRFQEQRITDLQTLRTDLTQQLEELNLRATGQRDKLAMIGHMNDSDEETTHLAVYRQLKNSTSMHEAQFDEPLEPGDTVRISFPTIK